VDFLLVLIELFSLGVVKYERKYIDGRTDSFLVAFSLHSMQRDKN